MLHSFTAVAVAVDPDDSCAGETFALVCASLAFAPLGSASFQSNPEESLSSSTILTAPRLHLHAPPSSFGSLKAVAHHSRSQACLTTAVIRVSKHCASLAQYSASQAVLFYLPHLRSERSGSALEASLLVSIDSHIRIQRAHVS